MLAKILLFATLALATCDIPYLNSNGEVTAMCFDEHTGQDFEFIDGHGKWDGRELNSTLADEMYTVYNASAPSFMDLERRDTFSSAWAYCKAKVSGACGNDHVISWTSNAALWISSVSSLVTAANSGTRENTEPRSICKLFSGGNICVSWSLYNTQQASEEQIKEISEQCYKSCQADGKSCEAWTDQNDLTQYTCVSNRATGCTSDSQVDKC